MPSPYCLQQNPSTHLLQLIVSMQSLVQINTVTYKDYSLQKKNKIELKAERFFFYCLFSLLFLIIDNRLFLFLFKCLNQKHKTLPSEHCELYLLAVLLPVFDGVLQQQLVSLLLFDEVHQFYAVLILVVALCAAALISVAP